MIVSFSFMDFCRPLDTLSLFQTSAFKSLATESDSQLPYAAKQMLARELALERMRRAEATYAQPATSPQNTRNSTEGVKSPPTQRKDPNAGLLHGRKTGAYRCSTHGPNREEGTLDYAPANYKAQPIIFKAKQSPSFPGVTWEWAYN